MLYHFDRQQELALLASAQSGDGNALISLLSLYATQAYRVALRITNNHEDAEDVLQESHLNAYRHLSQFRGESRFSTWLMKIVARQAVTSLRRRFSRREVSLDRAIESEDERWMKRVAVDLRDSPEVRAIKAEMRGILIEAMENMDDRCRVALELREIENLAVEEMAEYLKLSVPAVKARLFRARRKLHNEILKRLGKRPSGCRG
jgi:RNA polymerase sigma-70 factor (ECF subfamily)